MSPVLLVVIAATQTFHPYPGATYTFSSTLHQKRHVLKIDLTDKRIRLRVTSRDDAMLPDGRKNPMGPNRFAHLHGIQMAINGSIGGNPTGPTMHVNSLVKGYGKMWPLDSENLSISMHSDRWTCTRADGTTYDCSRAALMAFSADNRDIFMADVGTISFPENVIPDTYDVAMGGRPVIVWAGQVVDQQAPWQAPDDPCEPTACSQQPRTAWGLTQDKKTLILAVVDGRRAGADGKTTRELGDMMLALGAWWAFNLDGGGSSAMFIDGLPNMEGVTTWPAGIVNQPSDGVVRQVPLQLGIQVVKPYGHLRGTVNVPGAKVEAAYTDFDGASVLRSAVAAADGTYALDDIYAGHVGVTASAAGYQPVSVLKLVAAGDVNPLSFTLSPNGPGEVLHGASVPSPGLIDAAGANPAFSEAPVDPSELDPTDMDPEAPRPQPPAPIVSGCSAAEGLPVLWVSLLLLGAGRRRVTRASA